MRFLLEILTSFPTVEEFRKSVTIRRRCTAVIGCLVFGTPCITGPYLRGWHVPRSVIGKRHICSFCQCPLLHYKGCGAWSSVQPSILRCSISVRVVLLVCVCLVRCRCSYRRVCLYVRVPDGWAASDRESFVFVYSG